MSVVSYPAIIHRDTDGMWLEFPDLSGCYTQGDTVGGIMDNAKEALTGFLKAKMEHEEEIPKASDIRDIECSLTDIKTYVSAMI